MRTNGAICVAVSVGLSTGVAVAQQFDLAGSERYAAAWCNNGPAVGGQSFEAGLFTIDDATESGCMPELDSPAVSQLSRITSQGVAVSGSTYASGGGGWSITDLDAPFVLDAPATVNIAGTLSFEYDAMGSGSLWVYAGIIPSEAGAQAMFVIALPMTTDTQGSATFNEDVELAAGSYRFEVGGGSEALAAGSRATSFDVRFANATACIGDFDANGVVEADDLLAYLAQWFAGSFIADLTGELPAVIDSNDLLMFLSEWFGGVGCA